MTRIPATNPFSLLVWTYAWTVYDIREIPHMAFEEGAARYDPDPDDLFYVDELTHEGRIILKQPKQPLLH